MRVEGGLVGDFVSLFAKRGGISEWIEWIWNGFGVDLEWIWNGLSGFRMD